MMGNIKNEHLMWAIILPNGEVYKKHFTKERADMIKHWIRDGRRWQDEYKKGYRCVKIDLLKQF